MIEQLENLPLNDDVAQLKPLADDARQTARAFYQLQAQDPALKAVICPVKVKTALPDQERIEGATYEETEDKVWLPSMTEVNGSNNNNVAEGSQFEYWKDTTNAAKIKYQGSTARYWWLRGPHPGYANSVRYVYTSGVLGDRHADHAHGLVPGLCIG